jgi:hypothetical protein
MHIAATKGTYELRYLADDGNHEGWKVQIVQKYFFILVSQHAMKEKPVKCRRAWH